MNIYNFLIRFSSYNYQTNRLQIIASSIFTVEDWLSLFNNNICSNFIKFSLANEDIFSSLSENNSVNAVVSDAFIYKILKEIDNIV
mgnify:FL=1